MFGQPKAARASWRLSEPPVSLSHTSAYSMRAIGIAQLARGDERPGVWFNGRATASRRPQAPRGEPGPLAQAGLCATGARQTYAAYCRSSSARAVAVRVTSDPTHTESDQCASGGQWAFWGRERGRRVPGMVGVRDFRFQEQSGEGFPARRVDIRWSCPVEAEPVDTLSRVAAAVAIRAAGVLAPVGPHRARAAEVDIREAWCRPFASPPFLASILASVRCQRGPQTQCNTRSGGAEG